MSLFVVDASVGVKWLMPELHTDAALRLQNTGHQLHVPSFFEIEIGNVLWKKVQRGELTSAEGEAALKLIPSLPVILHENRPLLTTTFDLALKTKRTVYDCTYLALAIQLGGKMVTADDRFVNSLAGMPWAGSIIRVQDLP